jgi:phosphoribosylglycinamide formyltransferase 1
MRFAVLASTGGSVLRRAATVPFVRERLAGIVTDRPCGALDLADELGVPGVLVPWSDREHFGDDAAEVLDDLGVDVTFVFFTRLVGGALLERHLLNFHPSLLPAFPGRHGVEDALAHGVRVVGTTVHRVDAGMDTGEIVLQSAFAVAAGADPAEVRHQVFDDQCRSLVQLVHWLDAGQLAGAPVQGSRFVPALEHADALCLDVPHLAAAAQRPVGAS